MTSRNAEPLGSPCKPYEGYACRDTRPHWHRSDANPNGWNFHFGHSPSCRVCGGTACGGSCEAMEMRAASDD